MFSTLWSIDRGRWRHGCLEKSDATDRPSYGIGRKKTEPTMPSATSATVTREPVLEGLGRKGGLGVAFFSIVCFLMESCRERRDGVL